MFFLLSLLLLGKLLLHLGTKLHFLSGVAIGGEQGLCKLSELVVNSHIL
jgi:hypothetical protein